MLTTPPLCCTLVKFQLTARPRPPKRTAMAKSMVRASGAGAEAKIITVGERVIVHFDGLGWCAGAITKHKANGNYSIQFDDGTFEPDVGKDEPRRAGKASGPYPDGARVVVKFPNAGWYAGVVESLVEIDRESDQPVATYAVQFDDGDHHGDVISLQMLPEGASVASRENGWRLDLTRSTTWNSSGR